MTVIEITREQAARVEEVSLAFGGAELMVIASPDGTVTVRTPAGDYLSFDEDGQPPCVHESFDCEVCSCTS